MKGREISLAVDDVEAPPAGYADVLRRAESLRRKRNRWVAAGPAIVVLLALVAAGFWPRDDEKKATVGAVPMSGYATCLATSGVHLTSAASRTTLAVGDSLVIMTDPSFSAPQADGRVLKLTSSGAQGTKACAAFTAVAPGSALVHAESNGYLGLSLTVTVEPPGAHRAPALSCTKADLDAPTSSAMPEPETVTSLVTLRPGPNLTTLSAPSKPSTITAAQAWATATHGQSGYSTVGTEQLLYGSLYAETPATMEPDGSTKPIYDHVDVWVIWGQHMPYDPSEAGDGGPRAPGASPPSYPICSFGSGFTIIDATTGAVGFSASGTD